MRTTPVHRQTFRDGVAALAACALLAGCSLGGGGGDEDSAETVTLLTHESFSLPDEVVAAFEEESGQRLEIVPQGDAGRLTNELVLTKDAPLGDAVFGIDNTFASRAVQEDVLAVHVPDALPESAEQYRLDGEGADRLTPVDWGDVCVNVDDAWFAEQGVEPPASLNDLLDPAYEDLFVTPAPNTSSPGFAFLLATIGEYGEDGWQDYWRGLLDNGARVVSGWSDAYEVDFTAGGGQGDRPVVLSYSSSPPFTIPEGGDEPTTSALLDTCFRQVEYAGVLAGADNEEGARALVDFLVGEQVQAALPESMFVLPVDDTVELPELWSRWVEPAPEPIEVPAADIARHREEWLREWSDVTAR